MQACDRLDDEVHEIRRKNMCQLTIPHGVLGRATVDNLREHITCTYCILLPFHSRLIVSFVAFIVSLIHCNTVSHVA